VLGVAQETAIPVRFVGVGESEADLVDFEPAEFVRALFLPDEAHG
jgi:fused signal recognition particle receptor